MARRPPIGQTFEMTVWAVLSDVHANSEALEAVLADAEAMGADKIAVRLDVSKDSAQAPIIIVTKSEITYGGSARAPPPPTAERGEEVTIGKHGMAFYGHDRVRIAWSHHESHVVLELTTSSDSPIGAQTKLEPMKQLAARIERSLGARRE